MADSEPLLRIEELKVYLTVEDSIYRLIDGLSLEICRSQIVALVGGSGAGKTLAGLSVLGLLPAAARVAGGRIIFERQDLLRVSQERLQEIGNMLGVWRKNTRKKIGLDP